jgi:nucleoside 2-deoxyribosyltransferase
MTLRTATVSGSFRKSMAEIQSAVFCLNDLGVQVLSPADPRVVDAFGPFLYVASDHLRNIRLVQQRHLSSIAASDLLWLVATDGYVGTSAAMEIGYAAALGVPVFSDTTPTDLTLRSWVTLVRSPKEALDRVERGVTKIAPQVQDVLVDPEGAVERAHSQLEIVRYGLLTPTSAKDPREAKRAAAVVRRLVRDLV